jgi:hypothetical protein
MRAAEKKSKLPGIFSFSTRLSSSYSARLFKRTRMLSKKTRLTYFLFKFFVSVKGFLLFARLPE